MKGFIFDLDGVIVSTDEYHYQAWKAMADAENIYFDRSINNRLRGVSRMESLEIILERAQKCYTAEEKLALAEKKNEIYKSLLTGLTENDRLEGVTQTLEALRQRGYLLAIGSSSKNAPQILRNIGYEGFFDAVSDGNNIHRSKPDPEVFIKAAQMLGLPESTCYVVEDAKAGVDAGCAGGFETIAIGDAASYEKADHSIACFAQILEIAR